jgi:hypothetical protein
MLLECGKGGPCPALANELAKAGLTSNAERKWIGNFPVEGFKAPTQKLVQVGKDTESSRPEVLTSRSI